MSILHITAGGVCTSGTSVAGGAGGVKGGDSTASSFQSGGGTTYPGLSGGAAGRSILLNGNLITWENGNNAPQVKGPIQ